jgi:hypothetical protein
LNWTYAWFDFVAPVKFVNGVHLGSFKDVAQTV